jgi:hypothetical protein
MSNQVGLETCKPSRVARTHVEVGKDHEQTTVLWPEHVLGRDLDVVKRDVGGPGSSRIGRLDLLGLNTLASGYKEDSQAAVSPGADGLRGVSGAATAGAELAKRADPAQRIECSTRSVKELSTYEVVRVHPSRDPLLGTVDGPGLAVLALGRRGPETSDVRSRKRLGDSQTDDLFQRREHGQLLR